MTIPFALPFAKPNFNTGKLLNSDVYSLDGQYGLNVLLTID
jgi:hypothetical protein